MSKRTAATAEIVFESKRTGKAGVKITGVSRKLIENPERIRELMDLLELPKGTNARVIVETSDVIVR